LHAKKKALIDDGADPFEEDPVVFLMSNYDDGGESWRLRDVMDRCKQRGTTVWGSYLDTVGFLANSPIRPYIAQTMERRLRPEILTVFQDFGHKLTLTDLLNISENLTGSVHVLNKVGSETPLAGMEDSEKEWFFKHAPRVLPVEDLENFEVIEAWMEFILVRRVMKTLLYSITSKPWYERLELLRQGLSKNIVVNIELTINSRDGSPVKLRFHTVAPRTCNKLGYIEE